MPPPPADLAQAELRPAVAADWPRIWPIWSQVVAAADTFTYDPDTDSATAFAAWLGSVGPRSEVWVAETPGRPDVDADDLDRPILGVYHLEPNQGGPGSHIANGSYMVAATARGRGMGRQLVSHSLRRATELGFLGIQFNAVAASNTYAIKLYQELGFHTVGVIPEGFRHPRLGFVDLLVMYRKL